MLSTSSLAYQMDWDVAAPRSGDHYEAPTPRETSWGNLVSHHRNRNARNVRGQSARPLAYTITQGDWVKETQRVMREHVGASPGGAKRLADCLECSEATAKNYLEGRNAPSGILDLRAMHAIPAYAALKRQIASMEMDLDPRVQAKMMELYRMTMQLAGEIA